MTKPATKKQIEYLRAHGVNIKPNLTNEGASKIIAELPPTKTQIQEITELGGTVPKTRREAKIICEKLINTTPATEKQKHKALELGIELPDGILYKNARTLLMDALSDIDPEDGKPATKAQINKIVKLGGDPEQASNRWRTDDYIDRLEEQQRGFERRVDNVIDWMFSDADTRKMMSVKKPSMEIIRKALRYGDTQRWGENWEDPGRNSEYNPYNLMDAAVYSVAPELLKDGESVPEVRRSPLSQPKEKGCLSVILMAAGASIAFTWLGVWVIMKVG